MFWYVFKSKHVSPSSHQIQVHGACCIVAMLFLLSKYSGVTPLQIFRVIFLKVTTRAGRDMKQQVSRDDTLCRLASVSRRFEQARTGVLISP